MPDICEASTQTDFHIVIDKPEIFTTANFRDLSLDSTSHLQKLSVLTDKNSPNPFDIPATKVRQMSKAQKKEYQEQLEFATILKNTTTEETVKYINKVLQEKAKRD